MWVLWFLLASMITARAFQWENWNVLFCQETAKCKKHFLLALKVHGEQSTLTVWKKFTNRSSLTRFCTNSWLWPPNCVPTQCHTCHQFKRHQASKCHGMHPLNLPHFNDPEHSFVTHKTSNQKPAPNIDKPIANANNAFVTHCPESFVKVTSKQCLRLSILAMAFVRVQQKLLSCLTSKSTMNWTVIFQSLPFCAIQDSIFESELNWWELLVWSDPLNHVLSGRHWDTSLCLQRNCVVGDQCHVHPTETDYQTTKVWCGGAAPPRHRLNYLDITVARVEIVCGHITNCPHPRHSPD